MAVLYALLVIFLMLLEILNSCATNIVSKKINENSELKEFPLTKTLGYSINKDLHVIKKLLGDDKISQEYAEQYFDIMRSSRESFERIHNAEERRWRRLVGIDGDPDRRRRISRFSSAVGRRRQRSQEIRREKLKSQGLRNHLLHTKLILEYNEE